MRTIIEDIAGYVDEIDGCYDDIITTIGDDEYEVHHIVQSNTEQSSAEQNKVEEKKEEKVLTKADIARQIFAEKYKKVTRKEVIEEFMKEAGLTKAGAATYYQNFVQKNKK